VTDAIEIRAAARTGALHEPFPADVDEIIAAVAPGAIVSRRSFEYATSHRLEELDVRCSDGSTLRLVAKHLGRTAMSEAARLAKPAALHSAGRELAVYRHILAGAGLGTPVLIGGRASEGDNGVMVLERVEGTPLSEIGDFTVWKAAARWLARMHARFAAVPPRIPPSGPGPRTSLVSYDHELLAAAGRRGLERAAQQALGSAEVCVALGARLEYALRALASATPTLVHGDLYPSNIVVAGDRIAVVDWELAGTGPAVLDLAALAAGGWRSEQRHDLIKAYHEESLVMRRSETLTALVRRVELASLYLALRWVGSASDWDAPDEHRRDWFADAVAALARLNGGST
jgi:aminoglycoside phosphotransferase (APT) family kinase protein